MAKRFKELASLARPEAVDARVFRYTSVNVVCSEAAGSLCPLEF
jgi:hypothetical protein